MNPQDVIKLLGQIGELLEPTAKEVWAIYYRLVVTRASRQSCRAHGKHLWASSRTRE